MELRRILFLLVMIVSEIGLGCPGYSCKSMNKCEIAQWTVAFHGALERADVRALTTRGWRLSVAAVPRLGDGQLVMLLLGVHPDDDDPLMYATLTPNAEKESPLVSEQVDARLSSALRSMLEHIYGRSS